MKKLLVVILSCAITEGSVADMGAAPIPRAAVTTTAFPSESLVPSYCLGFLVTAIHTVPTLHALHQLNVLRAHAFHTIDFAHVGSSLSNISLLTLAHTLFPWAMIGLLAFATVAGGSSPRRLRLDRLVHLLRTHPEFYNEAIHAKQLQSYAQELGHPHGLSIEQIDDALRTLVELKVLHLSPYGNYRSLPLADAAWNQVEGVLGALGTRLSGRRIRAARVDIAAIKFPASRPLRGLIGGDPMDLYDLDPLHDLAGDLARISRTLAQRFPRDRWEDWINDHRLDHHSRIVLEGSRVNVISGQGEEGVRSIWFSRIGGRDLMHLRLDRSGEQLSISTLLRDPEFALAQATAELELLRAEITDPLIQEYLEAILTELNALGYLALREARRSLQVDIRREERIQAFAAHPPLPTLPDQRNALFIDQQQYGVLQEEGYLKTIEGTSCVVLTLYDRQTRTALLAHLQGTDNLVEIFDQFINHLVALGCNPFALEAQIFSEYKTTFIGQVFAELERRRIRIADVKIGVRDVLMSARDGTCYVFDPVIPIFVDSSPNDLPSFLLRGVEYRPHFSWEAPPRRSARVVTTSS